MLAFLMLVLVPFIGFRTIVFYRFTCNDLHTAHVFPHIDGRAFLNRQNYWDKWISFSRVYIKAFQIGVNRISVNLTLFSCFFSSSCYKKTHMQAIQARSVLFALRYRQMNFFLSISSLLGHEQTLLLPLTISCNKC